MTLTEPTFHHSPSLPVSMPLTDGPEVSSTDILSPAIEFEAYDPVKIQQQFQGQIFRVMQRWVTILWPFLLLLGRRSWDKRTPSTHGRHKRRAIQLRETLTVLGPAFIKIGQALSTRPDILTGPYLEELSKLQDQIPAFSNDIAFRFIEEELGYPPHELYAQLTSEPIAAASLGQVYKGKLHTGEWVAVKVQRPDLAEQVSLDIYVLRGLAAWVQKTNKSIRSDLVGILDEFAGRLFEEIDYTQEGRNAEYFAQLYGYLPEIYIPKIYWEYTHRRVLTMEWITGTKLNQPQQIQAQGINARHLIDVGVQCSLRQLLEHGFFHADPHLGNLLATPDGKLAYLDFGMMSKINQEQRYGLINAIVHIINREFEALAHDYVHLGFLTPETDLESIISALGVVFNDALGASVAELNIQSIFEQLSDIMYEYPFRVPSYYALIIRSLLTMEGIAIGVDKDFKVLSAAYPYIAKRILTDPAPELRQSLKDLLFQEDSFRWNRLENLMKNARNNFDYDLSGSLDQALDYLFSERGELIRDRLVQEIVNGIDAFGQTTWQVLTAKFREQRGWEINTESIADLEANLGHIQRILGLLKETPGFDPVKLASVIPSLLVKPEAQVFGQQIAIGLVQKALVGLFITMVTVGE
ncbi:AarF/ABC1/UbiB kinase family protein [Acaryochloris sp. CCMEE 5410]|uniref:ABC1 kinase family protein n=1 Tax=Acaryochloris sp. CCMEE 5410 TaxID=310037 RepID=UPI000319873E|nr:AarF/ABC1/UbiB kinase family protein [Acaryochloris sp. CCMEE 5410]KAI9129136.1 AarF/ABC1/UbiB kinase family protein [Acaryochloris sp. CCMEE 5410]